MFTGFRKPKRLRWLKLERVKRGSKDERCACRSKSRWLKTVVLFYSFLRSCNYIFSNIYRETMIVFVYDTECLKEEADDPVKAVLYFHPSWVSDTQKVALCGQLMGISYFLKDCFFKPKIMALQNGKFVLKEFGRFTLVCIFFDKLKCVHSN